MSDELDDLDLPRDDLSDLDAPPEFEAIDDDGMPDPLAAQTAPEDAEDEIDAEPPATSKKAKKAKKEKKPKEPKPPRAAGPGLMATLVRSDFYTVMLAIALIALLLGVLSLVIEWGRYGFQRNPRVSLTPPPTVSQRADTTGLDVYLPG